MSVNNVGIYDDETFNLSSEEVDKIQKILGRKPNLLELELVSILWSEHASYKNSLKWLNILPRKGDGVVIEAGAEGAGAIDIGDGMVCVFKLESHNHPCAVQPRLGAITGLRVVTRDIFSMGAHPLAFLNSLRFGDGEKDTARWLFDEVINGLADFEKGFGIPVVGGELFFCNAFNSSPIVNNMVVGIANKNELVSGVAKGKGNLIAIIGNPTGNEGIDGDAFTADVITDNGIKGISSDYLKNVEVEVKLYKLVQILIKEKLVVGIQPIGAQGIAGAVTEMAARGNSGVAVQTDEVPLREMDLSARDIVISETWGRLLVCFSPEYSDKIRTLALNNGVDFGIIGKVTADEIFSLYSGNDLLAQLPVKYLGLGGKAPVYDPSFDNAIAKVDDWVVDDLPEPDHYPKVAKIMINSLNLASKKYLSKKFSRSLRAEDTSSKFPSDAAIIEIKKNGKALMATLDCNPGYMSSDPFIGAQIAVAEAARNIVCAGGKPIAISDCLNFGNPNDPKAYGAFVASVKGIAQACKLFNLPVISGNVSFYNQHSIEGQIHPIAPSPIIGMVGILKRAEQHTTLSFKHKGDMIFLIGRSRNDINGSEYLRLVQKVEISKPPVYLQEEEQELHQVIEGLIEKCLVRSVHDVSNGGLFMTLLESSVPLEFGFDVTSDAEIRKDAFLFGEAQSRVVVSVSPEKQDMFVDYMVEQEFPFSILGHVTKGEIRIDDESYGFVEDYRRIFENRIKEWVEGGK